ncbi:coiled-coil domain-containing protein 28A isoform X1 [Octopus sinensis]|uniref:Coiled-coil domain-containing protein 28A isoform X1 n=2 Tax=Octopus sinensis TaxID=2607531 RepID=A0A6P7T954_9MOLL|nr:coiled-coil domain-containing protein 28A isoform X1 [Octopus sinensis]
MPIKAKEIPKMESDGQVTTSEEIEDISPQANNNCGATASSQVKWKKDMLTDMEPIEGKRQTTKAKISVNRPCKEHSFLTDVADVRMMEQGLLQLLDDFHSGKLQAFGVDSSCEKMDQIREQQERLARLHFDLDLQQDLHRLDTDMARKTANDNLGKLIDQLQCLSTSIQTLQQKDVPLNNASSP